MIFVELDGKSSSNVFSKFSFIMVQLLELIIFSFYSLLLYTAWILIESNKKLIPCFGLRLYNLIFETMPGLFKITSSNFHLKLWDILLVPSEYSSTVIQYFLLLAIASLHQETCFLFILEQRGIATLHAFVTNPISVLAASSMLIAHKSEKFHRHPCKTALKISTFILLYAYLLKSLENAPKEVSFK